MIDDEFIPELPDDLLGDAEEGDWEEFSETEVDDLIDFFRND